MIKRMYKMRISAIKERNSANNNVYTGMPINQSFRAAENKSMQEYEVFKKIKDAMEEMCKSGQLIDEAQLDIEIPPHMLREKSKSFRGYCKTRLLMRWKNRACLGIMKSRQAQRQARVTSKPLLSCSGNHRS